MDRDWSGEIIIKISELGLEDLLKIKALTDPFSVHQVPDDNELYLYNIARSIDEARKNTDRASKAKEILDQIDKLIVEKNKNESDLNKGKMLLNHLMRQNRSKFVLNYDGHGYSFSLVAPNGEVLLESELYSTERSCLNGIESVKKFAMAQVEDTTIMENIHNPKYEIYMDKAGEYRFRLRANNGQKIAVSMGYKSKAACLNAISIIKFESNEAELANTK